ncbi:hypothetical protein KUTeg_023432 [Tegillarca granosa]|uniref:Uncharacterized protein n=1 Tax=Tegillarca granosa TaxID=220873 RepID=A0ABQ9E672_TEGGR|nr:hypothetical protein KUTeg_023432 [Tegillarca granosa]
MDPGDRCTSLEEFATWRTESLWNFLRRQDHWLELKKKRYDPLTEITDPNETLSSMAIALRGVLPNACIFKGLPADSQVENSTCNPVLKSDVTTEFSCSDYSMLQLAEMFKAHLKSVNGSNIDTTSLTSLLMGYSHTDRNIKSLKYGLTMESQITMRLNILALIGIIIDFRIFGKKGSNTLYMALKEATDGIPV